MKILNAKLHDESNRVTDINFVFLNIFFLSLLSVLCYLQSYTQMVNKNNTIRNMHSFHLFPLSEKIGFLLVINQKRLSKKLGPITDSASPGTKHLLTLNIF